jgi:hypothetical protein
MRSHRGRSSSVQERLARRERGLARARRDDGSAFAARWAVAACDQCGRAIVMGEPVTHVRRFDREVVLCPACVAPVPETPTWVAAPARHGRPAVPLVTPERDLRRAA